MQKRSVFLDFLPLTRSFPCQMFTLFLQILSCGKWDAMVLYLLMVEFAYLPAKPDRYAIVLIAGILKEELFVVTQET